jgi:putative transposase
MADTYTQIYIHIVFPVKYREKTINGIWKDELYKYITGIVQNNKHKMISINGMSDHIHIFIGSRPRQSLSDLVQKIKRDSSKWINDNKLVRGRFEWQEGFGAFSYGKSQIKDVIHYIENQEMHHKNKTFREEYIQFLKAFDIDFEEKYIFVDPI